MELWLALAVLTAAVLIAVLRPLLRPAVGVPTPAEADAAVYRHQLAELDAERARGVIAETEAVAARTEIARRLLATADAALPGASPASSLHIADGAIRAAALALAVSAPLLAVALYLLLGAPNLPGQPMAQRIAAPVDAARLPELIARVEARLTSHPDDGNGWDVIAPVYLQQGRHRDAAEAFANATKLLGPTTRRLAGFAEATVLASNGIVTEPARRAYEELAALEPTRPEPRFWLALAKEQAGQHADAIAAYEALLSHPGANATFRGVIAERLAAVRGKLASSATAKATPERGPTADDVAAAATMPQDQRTAFIEQMVSGLAARLETDGGNLASWQRLIRAYTVLGRRTDAVAALADARRNLTTEPKSLEALDAFAKALGLDS